ncbi:MAG: TusE/DsrC/DsvC family sulfur relay protein [Gammaproteobacteria bacterium]|nr:TusE/DsrC/DsvC family sulfur relay protein [Gammaproteobacteria bacterium]MCW8988648.1 TusE/DsrC/DsvC family sulfur relay protein [Gammaproteobacteria bacterium]MCW9030451.1 TusE/DsrC/DsvC family sulfur relay protein [Gammaproteobacteria bacterium]
MEALIQSPAFPLLDEDGLILYPEQWNESMAIEIAHLLGIKELSPDHWLVINTLREYYFEFGVAPAMINVCHTHHKNDLWVHDLFATCLNAWRVAGLPNPGEEAKSYLNNM